MYYINKQKKPFHLKKFEKTKKNYSINYLFHLKIYKNIILCVIFHILCRLSDSISSKILLLYFTTFDMNKLRFAKSFVSTSFLMLKAVVEFHYFPLKRHREPCQPFSFDVFSAREKYEAVLFDTLSDDLNIALRKTIY